MVNTGILPIFVKSSEKIFLTAGRGTPHFDHTPMGLVRHHQLLYQWRGYNAILGSHSDLAFFLIGMWPDDTGFVP